MYSKIFPIYFENISDSEKINRIENNKYYLITEIINCENVLLVEGKAIVLKK